MNECHINPVARITETLEVQQQMQYDAIQKTLGSGALDTVSKLPRANFLNEALDVRIQAARTAWSSSEPKLLQRSPYRSQRIYDGIFSAHEMPHIDQVTSAQRDGLKTLFTDAFLIDYPTRSHEINELAQTFLLTTLDRLSPETIFKQLQCNPKLPRKFIDHSEGALFMAGRADIFRHAFRDIERGVVPKLPLTKQLFSHPVIDTIADFAGFYRTAGYPQLHDTLWINRRQPDMPLESAVALLRLARLNEDAIAQLAKKPSHHHHMIAYELFPLFKREGYSPYEASTMTGKLQFAFMGITGITAATVLDINPYQITKTLSGPKMRQFFTKNSEEIHTIFSNRQDK